MRCLKNIFIAMLIISMFSCISDPCESVFCDNNGECINGICLCEDGFTNADCKSTLANLVSGNYTAFNECSDTSIVNNSEILIETNTNTNAQKGIKINNVLTKYPNYQLFGLVQSEDSITFYNEIDSVITDTIISYIQLDSIITDTNFVVNQLDTTKLDTNFVYSSIDSLVVDSIYYNFAVIDSDGTAWRDKFNGNLNLKITYNIDSLLVTCIQLFTKN